MAPRFPYWKTFLRAAPVALLAALLGAGSAGAAIFVVDSTLDEVDATPGDALCQTASQTCTLRAAIQEANALPGPDVVSLPAGTYVLTRTGQAEDLAATGDLDVLEDLTIQGAGADVTIVDANADDRVLEGFSGVVVDLLDLTVRNGRLSNGTGIGGGALRVQSNATMNVTRCVVRDSVAAGMPGAGIFNQGTLVVVDTSIRGNAGENPFADFGQSGGGISNAGAMTVTGSTIRDNEVDTRFGGAGVDNRATGTGTIRNSTLSGNHARESSVTAMGGDGGAVRNEGTLTLEHVTVSDNRADGIANSLWSTGTLEVHASLIGNGADPNTVNCDGSITSLGVNLVDDSSCGLDEPDDRVTELLRIDVLADNGGPTWTHALLAGSEAIDALDPLDCPLDDQRGVARPIDGRLSGYVMCDAGAFERTGDFDADGPLDPDDNCPFVPNGPQTDSGGVGPGSPADGIGDVCQCGDLSDEGLVTTTDVALYRDFLADPQGLPLGSAAQAKCAVVAQDAPCNILDVAVLMRALAGTGQPIQPECDAATHSSVAGYWRVDETSGPFLDAGPAGNDAIGVGSVHGNGGNGFVGGAVDLEATEHLVVADDASLRSPGVTASAWVNADSFGATRNIAAKQNLGGFAWSLELQFDGRARIVAWVPLLGVRIATSASPIPLSTWTNVTGTYDPVTGTARIYVDGIDAAPMVSAISGGDLDHDDPSSLVIGARAEAPLDAVDGRVDEIVVFDLALTPAEVAQLFAFGPPIIGP